MEQLKEASQAGNIDGLYEAIRENPNVLAHIDDVPFVDTPLHVAASAGHIQYAMEIMRLMPSFAAKSNLDGFSPLHLALQNDHMQLVIMLVKKNSELVRVKEREDKTPLHYVVEKGDNLDILAEFLLVCPKSIFDVIIRDETALHVALKNDKFEVFVFLVRRLQLGCHEEAYLEKRILNWMDLEGNTILHIATSKNQLQLVQLLISCKVNINAKNAKGCTALDYAQDENQTEIRDLLCSTGAVKASSIPVIDTSVIFIRTDQKLKMAAEIGDINALYSIIEEDPCVLERIDQTPFFDTPLHIAASRGHTKFALEINRLKPSFSRKLNQDGHSSLHLAFGNENSETAFRLLEVDGHLVRVKGKMGKTPLHIAAERGKLDLIVQSLAACPICIEDITDNKETALHIAAKNDQVEVVEVMLGWLEYAGNDAVVGWSDNEGNTVLHIASLRNQIKVVRLLKSFWKLCPSFLGASFFNLIIFVLKDINPLINRYRRLQSSKKLLSCKNLEGVTAMDILERQGQMRRKEIKDMRKYAEYFEEKEDYISAEYLRRNIPAWKKLAIRSLHYDMRVSDQTRTGILTVAVLIAAATYQAILSPPRGLWQDDPSSPSSNVSNSIANVTAYHHSGVGTYVMNKFDWFSILNTSAFFMAIRTILDLLFGGPLSTVWLVFPLFFCYIAPLCFIGQQVSGRSPIVSLVSVSALSFIVREVVKEVYLGDCKKVVKRLQLKHHPEGCNP